MNNLFYENSKDHFKLVKKKIKVRNTTMDSYEWFDNNNPVARFHVFDW